MGVGVTQLAKSAIWHADAHPEQLRLPRRPLAGFSTCGMSHAVGTTFLAETLVVDQLRAWAVPTVLAPRSRRVTTSAPKMSGASCSKRSHEPASNDPSNRESMLKELIPFQT